MIRRDFLGVLAGLGLVTFFRRIRPFTKPVDDPVAGDLARFFSDKMRARLIGREYLRSRPAEADIGTLVALLRSNGLTRWNDRRSIKKILKGDFANSRTVNIHGWILSETETRLCALAWLS
jgi:hypothetical protein